MKTKRTFNRGIFRKAVNIRGTVFAATIILIYAVTVLTLCISLAAEYRSGSFNAQNRFNLITRNLSRISRDYEPRSKDFYDEFLASLGNVSDIAALQIKYGDDLIFSYPARLSDLQSINQTLSNVFSTTLFSENGRPLSLTSSIYLLRPSSIFYKGRIAFAVILGATIITALYLVFFSKEKGKATLAGNAPGGVPEGVVASGKESSSNTEAHGAEAEQKAAPDVNSTAAEEAATESPSDAVGEDSESAAPQVAESDPWDTEEEADDFAFADEEDLTDETEEVSSETGAEDEEDADWYQEDEPDSEAVETGPEPPASEQEPPEEPVTVTPSSGAPEGAALEGDENESALQAEAPGESAEYAPLPFGKEQDMVARLDRELVQSSSSGRDLSLYTLRIRGVDWTSECGRELGKAIADKAGLANRVFSYKDDGVFLIFQGQKLAGALAAAEELHASLSSVILRFDEKYEVFIGISSRSQRLISGSRLASESEAALLHTTEDSPIIAFKANPERYRDFLATEGEKGKGKA